ncbi:MULTISPECIES: hypothetical protein [unclassified Acidovorax]|uniref:hypothetical protein n=1 Tax=unclassified Acidovorax TaxID=2684926 RepID=UPI001178BE7E|nr:MULTISPECIES: hypothetical protein [unclassified Acidovorax]MBU4424994.1 hypothetical protein [Gammaproteobacteria bacterium]
MSAVLKPSSTIDPAQAALAALSRAGLRAAEEARRTNTYMVVEENGKVLHESPQQYLRKRSEQPLPESTKTSA